MRSTMAFPVVAASLVCLRHRTSIRRRILSDSQRRSCQQVVSAALSPARVVPTLRLEYNMIAQVLSL